MSESMHRRLGQLEGELSKANHALGQAAQVCASLHARTKVLEDKLAVLEGASLWHCEHDWQPAGEPGVYQCSLCPKFKKGLILGNG